MNQWKYLFHLLDLKTPEKIQSFNEIETYDLCNTGLMLYLV